MAAAGAGDHVPALMSPFKLGQFRLSHRVVLAPMTRCRAINNVVNEAHVKYYTQRSSPGGLLITEAVAVCNTGHGFPNSPGIYRAEQVEAWRKVVDAVHELGGIIFCQLWHVGRASHTFYQPKNNGSGSAAAPVSSTCKPISGRWRVLMPDNSTQPYSTPRSLTTAEIETMVRHFGAAAANARAAGFDGIEIHAGHGYLVDQFLKDAINDRQDGYGGSIPNRCRFLLEVVAAVAAGFGGLERVALRISPVVDHLDAYDSDPLSLGRYLLQRLNELPQPLCYLHLTMPRYSARRDNRAPDPHMRAFATLHSEFRASFKGALMATGGFTGSSADSAVRNCQADLVSFGRIFLANPDLPLRLRLGAPLNKYDRSTFYTSDPVKGFTDYPSLSHDTDRPHHEDEPEHVCIRASL